MRPADTTRERRLPLSTDEALRRRFLVLREPIYAGWEPNCCPSGFVTTSYALRLAGLEAVAIDADTFEALKQLTLLPGGDGPTRPPPSVDEVLDTIEARVFAKLHAGTGHAVWRSLAERLEDLRRRRVAGVAHVTPP